MALGVLCMLAGNAAGKDEFSGPKVKSDEIAVFDTVSLLMEVNTTAPYMVIGEMRFAITQFMVDGKSVKTALLDGNGNPAKIDIFKKGQTVSVRGFKLADDVYIADEIRLVTSKLIGKDYRKIDRMNPVDK